MQCLDDDPNKKKNFLVLRPKTQIMNLQTKSEIHQQEPWAASKNPKS